MRDETATWQPLAIVERYERVVSYLYPILQTAPRRHGALPGLLARYASHADAHNLLRSLLGDER